MSTRARARGQWLFWIWPFVAFGIYMLQFRGIFASAMKAFTRFL